MIVLEKWNPNKPISAIYFDGEKEKYFGKRFLIEQTKREDLFITEHPKSTLEIVSTDWRPIFEIEFTKTRGKEVKPLLLINMEEFIAPKGIKALGNQLSSDKLKNILAKEPLPFDEPEDIVAEELEVYNPEDVSDERDTSHNDQPTLF
jgi:topoisomerase-4 subunit A